MAPAYVAADCQLVLDDRRQLRSATSSFGTAYLTSAFNDYYGYYVRKGTCCAAVGHRTYQPSYLAAMVSIPDPGVIRHLG